MKGAKRTFLILSILIPLLAACSVVGNLPATGGKGFTLGIESPTDGSSLPFGPVNILYYAGSAQGISQVELAINSVVVNTTTSENAQEIAVFQYQWVPTSAGNYVISVRAQNGKGVTSDFFNINVTIEAPVQPTATPVLPTPTVGPTVVSFEIFDVKPDLFTFYYGSSNCGPEEITITASVNYPDEVYNMVLFTRFYNQSSNQFTNWDSGRSMNKISSDTYSVTLQSDKIPNYNEFDIATMFYQIVATRQDGSDLSRTTVFRNAELEACPKPTSTNQVTFKNYAHNVDTFYYHGTTCGPNEVTITTDVTNPSMAAYVIIFTRFKDMNSSDITNWDAGTTMKRVDNNSFSITLQSQNLDHYNKFDSSQMSYQFVATDSNDNVTGRSLVFDDIYLKRCP